MVSENQVHKEIDISRVADVTVPWLPLPLVLYDILQDTSSVANRALKGKTRDAFFDFAQWAFSPDGLPQLQVMAYGDFSFDGRFAKYNVILCRSHDGYRPLTRKDVPAWDLLQANMDMLSACPYDPIMTC